MQSWVTKRIRLHHKTNFYPCRQAPAFIPHYDIYFSPRRFQPPTKSGPPSPHNLLFLAGQSFPMVWKLWVSLLRGREKCLKVTLQTCMANISAHVDRGTSDTVKCAQTRSKDPNRRKWKFWSNSFCSVLVERSLQEIDSLPIKSTSRAKHILKYFTWRFSCLDIDTI